MYNSKHQHPLTSIRVDTKEDSVIGSQYTVDVCHFHLAGQVAWEKVEISWKLKVLIILCDMFVFISNFRLDIRFFLFVSVNEFLKNKIQILPDVTQIGVERFISTISNYSCKTSLQGTSIYTVEPRYYMNSPTTPTFRKHRFFPSNLATMQISYYSRSPL